MDRLVLLSFVVVVVEVVILLLGTAFYAFAVVRTLGPSIMQGGSRIIIIIAIIIIIIILLSLQFLILILLLLLGSRHAPDPEEDNLLRKPYRVKRI